MALPTIALAEHLTDTLPADWSILQGPLAQVTPLAVVIRSDSPWIEPAALCHDLQHYAAIAAVPAAAPADGEQTLYAIILSTMDNLPEGWRFVSANGITLDQSTGQPLLTARMLLEYANTDETESKLMSAPIVVYRPLLHLQPLDEDGEDDGSPVDVSCDMSSVELTVDSPITDVSTFCGNFQVPDDITAGATLEVTVNSDTDANWSALVGKSVRAELYDRTDATRYRTFNTQIQLNPSLYGPTTPGEARTFSFDVAVLSEVAWVSVPT